MVVLFFPTLYKFFCVKSQVNSRILFHIACSWSGALAVVTLNGGWGGELGCYFLKKGKCWLRVVLTHYSHPVEDPLKLHSVLFQRPLRARKREGRVDRKNVKDDKLCTTTLCGSRFIDRE